MVYVLDMTSPSFANILDLYQRVVSASVVEYLQKQTHRKVRRCVYSAPVVLWLMILQRLHANGTMAVAVPLLLQGAAGPLVQNCRRVRRKRISARTGGFCQARQKLPTKVCRQVGREMIEQLRKRLGLEDSPTPRVYLLDGSSIELEHTRELVRHYPPAPNQHGVSHWPVLKMVVLHELQSGLAEEPCWGPMFGPKAVSEQELAAGCMDRLAAGSVLVGDRNFGVLWVAHEAQRRSLGVVLRLTEVRAHKLAGGAISQEGEWRVAWRASRWDGGKKHRIAADTGRGGTAHWGSRGARQEPAMVVPVHYPGPTDSGGGGVVRGALEDRNGSAFAEADGASPPPDGEKRGHVGQRADHCRLRLQPGTRGHLAGGAEEPHGPAPIKLRDGPQCCRLRLAQTSRRRYPTISARILPGSETSCPVPTAAETASYLPATALAAPARLPFPERRKLSGIGHPACGGLPARPRASALS